MKPTTALTESGMPATSSANAPPVSANGTVARIASALRPLDIAAYSRPSTSSTAIGTTTSQPLDGALLVLELAAPREVVAVGRLHLVAHDRGARPSRPSPCRGPRR